MPRIPINEQPNCKCGIGRKAGSHNALTTHIKETIAMIADEELPKLAETMDSIRKKSPVNYAKLVIKLAELILPKKQEVEITNDEAIDVKATLTDIREKLKTENGKDS